MPEFFDELRKLREARGVTLEGLHRQTRIPLRYLRAIEAGEFSLLPEPYIRAFIREYSHGIGVDERATLEAYTAFVHGNAPGAGPPPSHLPAAANLRVANEVPPADMPPRRPQPGESSRVSVTTETFGYIPAVPKRRADTNLTIAIASAVVLLAGVVFYALVRSTEPKDAGRTSSPAPPPPLVQQPDTQTPAEPQASDAGRGAGPSAAVVADSLTLEAVPRDSVWISVGADTGHASGSVLRAGARRAWRAKNRFVLTVGNVRSVTFFLNGRQLDSLVPSGAVARNVVIGEAGVVRRAIPDTARRVAPATRAPAIHAPPPKKPLKGAQHPTAKTKTGRPVDQRKPKAAPQTTAAKEPKPFKLPSVIKKAPVP